MIFEKACISKLYSGRFYIKEKAQTNFPGTVSALRIPKHIT